MEGKKKLIRHLKKLRKSEFYSRIIKIILLSIFVLLTPIVIYEKFIENDIVTALVLLFAVLFFVGFIVIFYKSTMVFYDIKNSRIYQCIEDLEAITEIVITQDKIVFEIKGMEDETIFLKQSEFRKELILSIKEVFGENKIANIN